MALTTLSGLFDPQVVGNLIENKYVDNMVFAPLAEIDNTLQGRPGDILTLPKFSYIGDASVLAEGSELTPVALTASTVTVGVYKVAQGVTLSDEALLSGFGDPYGEAATQIAVAVANAVDNKMLAELSAITGTMAYTTTASTVDLEVLDICKALEKFGEDIDVGEKVVVVSPAYYTKIRQAKEWLPASEIAADRIVKGAVGEVYGCQIIVSNKLKDSTNMGNAFIVKPGALRLILKRDFLIEADRDILKFTNTITASKHFACYLYNTSKAIKLSKKAS